METPRRQTECEVPKPSKASRTSLTDITLKYGTYDLPIPVPFNSPTSALSRLEGSQAAVTEYQTHRRRKLSREINQSHALQTPPSSAPGASLRGASNFSPPSLQAADHRHAPPSQSLYLGLEPLISLYQTQGREVTMLGRRGLGMERKAPLLPTPTARNFGDSITQPWDQVHITEHLSARRGVLRQMSEFGEWERGRRMSLFL